MMINPFDNYMFGNKNRKVIEAIEKYYTGELTQFPFELNDLKKARRWYLNNEKNLDETLVQRISIMEKIISKSNHKI